jgi:spore germination protein Q
MPIYMKEGKQLSNSNNYNPPPSNANNFNPPQYAYPYRQQQGAPGTGTGPVPGSTMYGGGGGYYPPYQGGQQQVPGSKTSGPADVLPGQLPIEQSYIENILRLNKGKLISLYATFENNREWNAKKFEGIIEAAGRDHVILSNPQTGERDLIPMVYVDYITFSEPIEYEYPFGAGPGAHRTYPPR